MSNSEDEGTPLEGPLPLELQQIQADSQRQEAAAAAAALRRKSAETQRKVPGGKGDICIKIRRSSTGDTVQVVDGNSEARRSCRPIKRRKFDDEVLQEAGAGAALSPLALTPVAAPPVPDPSRSRNSSSCESPNIGGLDPALVNSCQALPDLKLSKKKRDKKKRRDGTYKDLGRWKATDDLALINAVQQTRDLGSVFKGVKFSCHFTLAEIQERWYALMYDPVISKLAMEAVRNLPQEVVLKVSKAAPFSREEEDAIASSGVKSTTPNVDTAHFEKLLCAQPGTFHPSRSARALLSHWQYMKQYSLLPDQTVQPLPRPDTAQHILNFHDGEDQVQDAELQDPPDTRLNTELMVVDRVAKREIRRLEAEVSKWQIVVEQVTGQPTADFDNQTLAVLRGRLVRYLMRSREISVGRATPEHTVDVDLTLEGPATKVSRRQAVIKLTTGGEFHIGNEGRRPVMVNGTAVVMGEAAKLANNTVVEFCNLRFVFLINTELIEAIRTEAAKNQFVARKHVTKMEDKLELGGNNFDVEEGPLEETIDSPRFYNLSVEETVTDVQLQDASAGPHGRGRIVFSPDGNEGYLTMSLPQAAPGHVSDTDTGGPATDRTGHTSPGSNVSSTVSTTGRRYLEWDYGSDLGLQYHTQGEAAMSLSQLEKLAISNYQEYLGEEKKSRDKDGATAASDGGETVGDQVAEKFSKFADSLMRQRQLQQQSRQSVIRTRTVGEAVRPAELGDMTAASRLRSPVKSSSLGSLAESQPHPQQLQQHGSSRCSSSVSCHSLTPAGGPAAAASLVSGPSSSSSAGTIIARGGEPRSLALPGLSDVMRKLSLDILDTDSDHVAASEPENNSVSTVSTMEDGVTAEAKVSASSSPPEKPKVVWSQDPDPAAVSNFQTFSTIDPAPGHAHPASLPPQYFRARQPGPSTEPSSVPSTSDEEQRGDTSTMGSCSAQMTAKSFEYIPGSSYQGLQENSSSYEYLPGHLVADTRPPTVLNTRPDTAQDTQAKVAEQFSKFADNLLRPRPATNTDTVDTHQPSLDLLSLELREKSKDLMAKNISQTKHFFKKLKSYIEYLSTPSLTLEDSRVKQELAERIMALLCHEESRLGSSGLSSRQLSVRSLSLDTEKRSGETSTRQLPWPEPDTQPPASEDTRARSRGSELSSALSPSSAKESDTSSRLSEWKQSRTKSELEYQLRRGELDSTEAVEIVQKLQRKRLEHMKKLKKEMKKLEKIDHMIVGAAVGKKVGDVTEDTSVASSVTSVRSEEVSVSLESGCHSQDGASSQLIRATRTKTVTNTNILKINSPRRSKETKEAKEKKRAEKENNPNLIVMEHISPIITRSPKRSSNKSPVRTSQNFGQVYPSDSDTNTMTDSNVETLNSNGTFITKKSPKQRKKVAKKDKKVRTPKKNVPVAYYLPVDNLSPIRIGSRVLREKNNGWAGAGTRNIVSSYISALDPQPLARPAPAPGRSSSEPASQDSGLTLQQALATRRRDFVRSCERRVVAMKRAREARELRAAKQEEWLEQLATRSPRSQRWAEPSFTPVPVVRVFNHREMVQATRDKYEELPEVRGAKLEARRSVKYRGHRLMGRIYSSRLQRKVVGRRQVSFTHHHLVV